ncbi:MAG TPA: Cof-type HAD-IIB family hydrolase [Caldisericia bacterium]|nr:Cof-type HAD-IIB family hydrolase [Caldisericia bacterium]HPF48580.1 Cof-type HAD-IIB family hydrolase [Caldisericia bacterium]HPI83760.1 Cof-type HAD-IIB family hydrolase [Caldisericia bacterium]HPQ93035.1 Cof-type HAD-IIB family hydrolase [Caldisericia bacterium]HRV75132.1 Cof-type HAD-IIB family hydrolase [Caldisericia bacterium]
MIEAVCLDLDGTLLDDEKSISQRNLDSVRRFRESGRQVILASGRRYGSILPYAAQLGFDCPIIAYSGSLIQHSSENTPCFHKTMQREYAVDVIKSVRGRSDLIGAYINDIFHIDMINESLRAYERRTSMKSIYVPDLVTHLEQSDIDPIRIFILAETNIVEELYCSLKGEFDGKLDFVRSWSTFLECGAVGVSKGLALSMVADCCGFDLKHTVAFGDQENDISAFEVCGMSFAMGNASSEVKNRAKAIAPSNVEDGVAVVLERLMVC